jgi:subtilisin family serine protease
VAVIAPGSSTVKWSSVGGTSLATPQWAGLIAIANALRAVNGKAALGAPQPRCTPDLDRGRHYASTFADITKGSHGTAAPAAARPATTRPPAWARRTAPRCCPPVRPDGADRAGGERRHHQRQGRHGVDLHGASPPPMR